MFISRFAVLVIKACNNWYQSLGTSKIAELEDYIARLEKALEECEGERDFQEYFLKLEVETAKEDAKVERENAQYWQARLKESEEEHSRELQERRNREEEEEQQHYRSFCPHCGSRFRFGRCPACDEAFGKN